MISLENEALDALARTSMRVASSGKRFRNDMIFHRQQDPQYKLTKRQALYLWSLVDMYRRQIPSEILRRCGAQRKITGELPEIYLPGDLRDTVERKKKNDRDLQNLPHGN